MSATRRREARWVIAAAVLMTTVACGSPAAPDVLSVTGTVRHYDFEGGFWAVRGDDEITYDPVGGLPAGFQYDGLRVVLLAKLRPDLVSFHGAGMLVEVVRIRRL